MIRALYTAASGMTAQQANIDNVAHNRLWVTLANAFGHEIKTFGSTQLSEGGPLALS